MSDHQPQSEADQQTQSKFKPLRKWIPLLLVVLMVTSRFVPGMIEDGPSGTWMIAAFGPLLGSLGIVLWWLLLSRATLGERLIGAIGIVGVIAGVCSLLHESMLGAPIIVMTIPLGIGGFAVGSILFGSLLSWKRTWAALLMTFVFAGFTALLQNYGVWGNFGFDTAWRWSRSPEEVFLAEKASASSESANLEDDQRNDSILRGDQPFPDAQWPGFRGPLRDGVADANRLSDDWEETPPKELWRIKVGPAWSSFAVAGNLLFTQEQRGESESIVCYDADSGREIWSHDIQSRFFEALGGLGPRATPTLDGDKLYALGAEGWLTKLDARSGDVLWQHDLREVADKTVPMWGFSSSPLVIGDVAIVHAGGADDLGVLAFRKEDGEVSWTAPAGEMSYSSPQTITVAGREVVAILTDLGAHLYEPEDGSILLDYEWKHNGYRALQAQVINGNQLLIPSGMGSGTRLTEIAEQDGELTAEELWTSRRLKPDFNDLVVHDGHIYGFDDSIFTCIDLSDGKAKWKKGRYGKGQVLLLRGPGRIIVAGEKGELVLLDASPEAHRELSKIQAMNARTWNHPVVVGNRLYLRNAEEAVCYELPTADESPLAAVNSQGSQ